jgi:universal stress protein A
MNENFAEYLTAIKVREVVEIGTPYKRIVEKAVEEGADMIIMCTHGRTGLLHMLIGSVTEQVVRRAPCAVLSVPPPKAAAPTDEAE